jgi:hypothetical protein
MLTRVRMRNDNGLCFFDLLPAEILHILFSYFLAHEILSSLLDVSDYVNSFVLAYSAYQVDFTCIKKSYFDLVCQHIRPEQIISLTLSDDTNTPGLSEIFFSQFRIEQFIQLRSFKLIEIEYESIKSIFPNLYKLHQLHSFSFNIKSLKQKYPARDNYYADISTQINLLLSDTYSHVLPQITYLYLYNDDFLDLISLSSLSYLKLDTCSVSKLKAISKNAPQLQSLHIHLELEVPNLDISSTLLHLTQLNLKITSKYTTCISLKIKYNKILNLIINNIRLLKINQYQ